MRVRFTPNGRSQFLGALTYIRRDNPLAAQRFRERAEQVLKRLERFPNSGRHLSEFPQLPHREVIVWPYRFFYRQQGEIIWVVAVWHGAQIPKVPDSAPAS
ncbi:MAG: type II toxin-antitoxin system RelE/ParE family toxin [Deltaproteobacteria bacterium]|nr:type II toxin-antitoxin system RelE/ParE family toxin [Deltaproteobacteria bacterium]